MPRPPAVVPKSYRTSLFGQRTAECQNHIQWLFFCWVVIGMLATTNIVTCIFACWTRKNAATLTSKAFNLALSVRDKSKISADTCVVMEDGDIKKRESRE